MMSGTAAVRRLVGAASRRLERPELLAVFDAAAREAQREAIGIEAVLAASLGGSGVYVDVGTNRGQVLREAVRVAPAAAHIAFEPIPGLAAEVAREFPGVDCRQKALGAKPEMTEFCHFRRREGWSGLRRSTQISDTEGDPEYITVEVSTLDIELAGITPSVVKIDVEGAELAVFEGARGVLGSARPLVVFEHVYSAAALYGAPLGGPWDILAELDYEVFAVTGAGPFTREQFVQATDVVNWLASPRR
jgi:FkbM family methyltransferase